MWDSRQRTSLSCLYLQQETSCLAQSDSRGVRYSTQASTSTMPLESWPDWRKNEISVCAVEDDLALSGEMSVVRRSLLSLELDYRSPCRSKSDAGCGLTRNDDRAGHATEQRFKV